MHLFLWIVLVGGGAICGLWLISKLFGDSIVDPPPQAMGIYDFGDGDSEEDEGIIDTVLGAGAAVVAAAEALDDEADVNVVQMPVSEPAPMVPAADVVETDVAPAPEPIAEPVVEPAPEPVVDSQPEPVPDVDTTDSTDSDSTDTD